DDAHHAEDEREASREKKEQGAVRHAVEELADPEVHDAGQRRRSRGALPPRGRVTARDCTIAPLCVRPARSKEARVRLPNERFDYSPLHARRPWKLLRGARNAAWTIVHMDEWDIEKPKPR